MNENSRRLPTPHLAKLQALLKSPSLPESDRPRVAEAVGHYKKWVRDLLSVMPGQKDTVKKMVEVTNRYRFFIDLNLIFDSSENFLYRQRGQIKLNNSILEEFLPQLVFRALSLEGTSFDFGPQKTFAGLTFASALRDPGDGGRAALRTKNQDFVLGRKIHIQTSFDPDCNVGERLEAHLGYVCAECKTNLDKTMFQEAVATSRDLKTAVPSSLYFLVCEFLDMSPMSIATTQIDDVLIVRKAKRMSANERKKYSNASDRLLLRERFMEFLYSTEYQADVFQRMIDTIQSQVDDSSPSTDQVLVRGYF